MRGSCFGARLPRQRPPTKGALMCEISGNKKRGEQPKPLPLSSGVEPEHSGQQPDGCGDQKGAADPVHQTP
ncbi:hypothetical protein AD945_00170 [Gluconobacter albidus]|uniref:Uncharacterized protein n=1 Tax=Gluconobacter albidus TaxID=318683 RepID=A0A149TNX2_9PROT|nr:hypothetical protein AD945_00170 [Gluconobacter albidus]